MEGKASSDSVRFRVTALATLIFAVVLAVTAVSLVIAQRRLLLNDLDRSLSQRADDLQAALEQGASPRSVNQTSEDSFVRVTSGAPAREGFTIRRVPGADDDFRVVSRAVDAPGGPLTLKIGRNLDNVRESANALGTSLAVAIPAVALIMAMIVWWVAGRALARVEEANLRERRFVADASHELRSPLARIRSEIEVDLAHPGSADLTATHRSVLAETTGLQRMVDDLLHLAKSDAGELHVRREPVDLDDIVLEEARRMRADNRVTIDVGQVSAAQAPGDKDLLKRAISNLAENALRHARSRVGFELSESGEAAVLAISDDGPGIPPSEHDRVFERFSRLDQARAHDGGAGLGLAIARDIILRHGGTIRIDGDYQPGARFVIELPLRPQH